MAAARAEGCGPAPAAGSGWLCRVALAGALGLAMAACFDGYPQQQEPIVSPYDMTQEQRLAQINELGAAARAGWRWSYGLLPGCVLRVHVRDPQGRAGVRDIPLLGQAVSLAANRDQGGYQVELQSSDGRDPEAALAISSEKWADASWMLLLLRLLQKDCAADTALRPVP
jgi:hypothetical protein